jgi:hypothetical protein
VWTSSCINKHPLNTTILFPKNIYHVTPGKEAERFKPYHYLKSHSTERVKTSHYAGRSFPYISQDMGNSPRNDLMAFKSFQSFKDIVVNKHEV